MCDPISIGLTLAGTALQAYGQSQVGGAQRRDIRASGQSYEAERGRQKGFEQENTGTVADTLKSYSPDAMGARTDAATATRQKSYVSPLASHNFVADAPANDVPNAAVMSRNAVTGNAEQSKSISQALAKGRLDAYGDAQTGGNIAADNNANKIGTVARIASGSQRAEGVQQNALGSKLEADKGAGAFAGGLGDLFTTFGMLGAGGAGGGGMGAKIFGGPGSGVGGGLFGMGKPIGQNSGMAFNWS